MDLVERFRLHLRTLPLPTGRALVAVSGGTDSLVLLDLLRATAETHGLDLVVAHADHGLAPESAEVAVLVERTAREAGLPVEIGQLRLAPGATETVARVARYRWLDETRRRVGAAAIVTAHHADDQTETVLLRLLRGSGPAGLAAMAPVSGALIRPLLPFRRSELEAYARERGIAGWQDPANAEPRHLRSWCRVELLPMIRRRLPDVDDRLLRAVRQARAQREAWDAVLDRLPGLDVCAEPDGISIAAPPVDGYDSSLGAAVLQAAARRAGFTLGEAAAGRLLAAVRAGRSGATIPLGGDWVGEISFGRVRIVRRRAEGPPSAIVAGAAGELTWGAWRLTWRREPAPAVQRRAAGQAWFAADALAVRPWRPGDWIRPLGGRGRRLAVRCFQDARVPRGRRSGWPVVTDPTGVVLWIPGVCRADQSVPDEGTEALRVDAALA